MASSRLLARELVDGRQQPRLTAGEVLHRGRASAGRYDGDEVVHADKTADELLRRGADERGAAEIGLQIVEHEENDAAIEVADVRADVGFDDRATKERRIRAGRPEGPPA